MTLPKPVNAACGRAAFGNHKKPCRGNAGRKRARKLAADSSRVRAGFKAKNSNRVGDVSRQIYQSRDGPSSTRASLQSSRVAA